MPVRTYHLILLATVLIVWIWSAIKPQDTYLTWFLETLPFMMALPIILLTYKKFRLTDLTYTLIALHAMILMLGAHYSYAKVPLGLWMEEWFGWTRNNYDKIGHLMQGFGPAIYAREIIARTSPVQKGKWLAFSPLPSPWPFPHYMRFWNGPHRSPTPTTRKLFWEPRDISGIPKPTCFYV